MMRFAKSFLSELSDDDIKSIREELVVISEKYKVGLDVVYHARNGVHSTSVNCNTYMSLKSAILLICANENEIKDVFSIIERVIDNRIDKILEKENDWLGDE